MINKVKATELTVDQIRKYEESQNKYKLEVILERTIEFETGWMFFCNSKKHIKTKAFIDNIFMFN